MKVIVCGSRHLSDAETVWRALDELHRGVPYDTLRIMQGGATGADQISREWCTARHVPYYNFPADWERYGRAAGPLRNQEMLDAGPDLVIAFPGGRGTADMVRRARSTGVPVREI